MHAVYLGMVLGTCYLLLGSEQGPDTSRAGVGWERSYSSFHGQCLPVLGTPEGVTVLFSCPCPVKLWSEAWKHLSWHIP